MMPRLLTKGERFIVGAIPLRWENDAWRNRDGHAVELERTLCLQRTLRATRSVEEAVRQTAPSR